MIVVRLQGGLGNQMFQYAYGLALAASGRAEVRFDNSSFATDTLRDFALSVWRAEAPLIDRATAARLPRRFGGDGWLTLLRGEHPLRKTTERPFGFHPRHLRPRDHAYLCGYWQDERFFAAAADGVRRAFRPARELGAETRATIRQIESTNAVAVHVRRTDYLKHPTLQVCDADYHRRRVEELLAEQPGVTAFVFSDDLPWCRANLRLACPTHYVGHTTGATAHEDLWMISRCRHHVIPNSSFSWWGAWLGEDPSGVTFAPTPWFNDPRQPGEGVAPPRWRRAPGRADTPAQRAA